MTLRYPICRYATSVASLPRASAIRRWGTTHRSNRRRLGLLKYNAATHRAATARAYAHLGMIKQALDLLRTLVRPLELAPGWVPNFTRMACDGTSAVWLLNHVEEIEVIERNLRQKVVAPDFRYPMQDGRLSLARLCSLRGHYDEAAYWFA
jgi:hypothetical protein